MNRIRKILVTSLLAASVVCVGLTSPTPAHATATDCSQTAGYGDRICLDPTTGFGPLVQIFTSGGAYWNAFPVTILPGYNLGNSAASSAFWTTGASGASVGAVTTGGASTNLFVGAFASGPGSIAQTNNATYISWLQWFGYDPSYPWMEFVVVD